MGKVMNYTIECDITFGGIFMASIGSLAHVIRELKYKL